VTTHQQILAAIERIAPTVKERAALLAMTPRGLLYWRREEKRLAVVIKLVEAGVLRINDGQSSITTQEEP
jgi:hypothetical protein